MAFLDLAMTGTFSHGRGRFFGAGFDRSHLHLQGAPSSNQPVPARAIEVHVSNPHRETDPCARDGVAEAAFWNEKNHSRR
jgi:hypothetical protein